MRVILIALLLSSAFYASAQNIDGLNGLKPFTSLCIEDNAVGFNWRNGQWVNAVFAKGDKIIFEKIDYQKADSSNNFMEKPLLCSQPKAHPVPNNFQLITACYSIRKFGDAKSMLNMNDCYESYKDGVLTGIQCKSEGHFLPNGPFVKLPSHVSMDLSNKSEKDSVVVSVGKCAAISN